jgi:hypothetical protein
MNTTTIDPYRDVPVPAGAYVADGWDGEDRLIVTETKEVEGTRTGVSIDARQLPDGSLLRSPGAQRVLVDQRRSTPGFEGWQEGLELTAAGARQLARALVQAAEQLGEWDVSDPGGKIAP